MRTACSTAAEKKCVGNSNDDVVVKKMRSGADEITGQTFKVAGTSVTKPMVAPAVDGRS